jgi:hypothetical protein
MEPRDGYIADVFVYCDSWCTNCPFTLQCLVFGDAGARHDRQVEMLRAHVPRVSQARRRLRDQATGYRTALQQWCCAERGRGADDLDCYATPLFWNAWVIASRTSRALAARSRRQLSQGHPDGLAKVALIAVDTSVSTWDAIAADRLVPDDTAERFRRQLQRLGGEIDSTFPNARGFVRPGFDQPAARWGRHARGTGVRKARSLGDPP